MSITPEPTTNLAPSLKRMVLGHQALPSLNSMQGIILEEAQEELAFPTAIKTFDKMVLDTNIASAIAVFETFINKIEWSVEVPNNSSAENKKIANLLNKNLYYLDRPFQEYINEVLLILRYGFCPLEKVYQKNLVIDGETFIGWKHFPLISQSTITKWFFDDKTGELKGLVQNVQGKTIRSIGSLSLTSGGDKEIGRHKFLLFRFNPKKDNPEGNSPLKSCYITWKYLSVIDEFEAIGVAKDVGGIAVFEIDQDYLREANSDPDSWQADNLEKLKQYAASLTAGDQSYLFLPQAYNDQGKPLFSFKLQGIEGGGKQYNTQDIALRHSNKMLMAFFADVLKLGSESHGSFALADSKTSLLANAIGSLLESIRRTLNHDLIRQTYALNDWEYDPLTSAGFQYSDIEKEDLGVLSSAIQRIMAVGGMRQTSDIEDTLRGKILGLASMKEANPEILGIPIKSGAGEGMEEGLGNGTGVSTAVGVDRSKSNRSNK